MSNARFSITPSAAVEDTTLSDSVFRTLACLGVYGDKNGWCWPALQTIANMRGVSKPRVSADIKILIDKGYVQKRKRFEQNTQITNMYRILFDTPLTPEVNPPLTPEINPPLTPEVNQNAPLNGLKEEKNIFTLYSSTIGPITANLKDELTEYNSLPYEWLEQAFKLAADSNARRWAYIRTILDGWKVNGYGWKPEGKYSKPASKPVQPQYYQPKDNQKFTPPPQALKDLLARKSKEIEEAKYALPEL